MKKAFILGFIVLLIIGGCIRKEIKFPQGAWKLVQRQWVDNGKVQITYPVAGWNAEQIKVWSGIHWMYFTRWQRDTIREVEFGGGTYKLEGSKYFETIDYHSSKNWEGRQNVGMNLELIKDTLIQTFHPIDANRHDIDTIHIVEKFVRLD